MVAEGIVTERAGQKILVFAQGGFYPGIPLGKVRKREKIYAGDRVKGRVEGDAFVIEEVEERKNLLPRPRIANVDRVVVVNSVKDPDVNTYLLDNLLVVYESLGVNILIVFNKIDLADSREELERLRKIYESAGYPVIFVSAIKGEGLSELSLKLKEGITVFAGPSGAGKSSIVSKLTGERLRIGDARRGRGRHTTREVKLIPFLDGFVGDSPGFEKIDASLFLPEEKIRLYFPEFLSRSCRFSDCTHTLEEGCGVVDAVRKGEIALERYRSYLRMIGKQDLFAKILGDG